VGKESDKETERGGWLEIKGGARLQRGQACSHTPTGCGDVD